MASTIEKKDGNIVVLTIDVSPEDFAGALSSAFKKNAKNFSIPGFRKGKAPMNIVTKYYGEGVLYDDAIDFAAGPAYSAAIEEHGIEPVSRPELDIVEIGRDVGLKFTLTVTVKPEVKLGKYLGVEAVKPQQSVSDEAVDAELTKVQERNSRMIPVEDRAIENDDTVNIDYEGFLDGVPFEGGKGESYDLKVGSNTFIPGFEEKLIGHETGASFDIDLTFPEDYHSEELKGKDVVFKVTVNEIKVKELPVLDDEFAKDVSEFDSLDEYKESLRKNLVEAAENRAKATFEENVIQAAVKNAEIDLPQVMIDQEIDRMADEQSNQMRYQGIELDQYLGYIGQTMETFKAQLAQPAESRVRTQLVLEAIAKAEKVEVSDEDIDQEIERMATMYGMKVEDLKSRITPGEDGFVRDSVVQRKTVELMSEKAVEIDEPVAEETVEEKPKKKAASKKTTTAKKATTTKKSAESKSTTAKKTPAKKATPKKAKPADEDTAKAESEA